MEYFNICNRMILNLLLSSGFSPSQPIPQTPIIWAAHPNLRYSYYDICIAFIPLIPLLVVIKVAAVNGEWNRAERKKSLIFH